MILQPELEVKLQPCQKRSAVRRQQSLLSHQKHRVEFYPNTKDAIKLHCRLAQLRRRKRFWPKKQFVNCPANTHTHTRQSENFLFYFSVYADKEAKNDIFKRVNRTVIDKPSMIISSSSSATEPSKTIRVSTVATIDNGNKSAPSVFARLGGKQSLDDDLVTWNEDVVFSGILKKAPEKVSIWRVLIETCLHEGVWVFFFSLVAC